MPGSLLRPDVKFFYPLVTIKGIRQKRGGMSETASYYLLALRFEKEAESDTPRELLGSPKHRYHSYFLKGSACKGDVP